MINLWYLHLLITVMGERFFTCNNKVKEKFKFDNWYSLIKKRNK